MILTVTNQKGGVGKTTTALTLGVGLGNLGKNVCLIDLDSQGNLSESLRCDGNYTSIDLLDQKEFDPEKKEGVDVVKYSITLANPQHFENLGKEFLLKKALEKIKAKYDYIILDTPPNLGLITTNALIASDEILIPMMADMYSVNGLTRINEIIEIVKENYNPKIKINGIVLVMYNPRTIISKNLKLQITKLSESMNTCLYKSTIRSSTLVKESQLVKKNIFLYAPKSTVADDYKNLIKEFLKRNGDQK